MTGVKLSITTTKNYSMTFSRTEFIHLLNGESNRVHARIPADAKVTMQIPGGGDHSGETLSLDDVDGVTVSWSEVSR